jgi:multiple sugar transport system permease protein
MRSYYRGVPDELEESSFIDGYGVFQTFFKIILPISGPMLITVFILAFAWQWTDIFYVNTFLPNAESFLLTSSKFWSAMPETLDLLSEAAGTNAKTFEVAVKNTAGLLVVLPLIIMYIFCQRYLVQGIESSGLAN